MALRPLAVRFDRISERRYPMPRCQHDHGAQWSPDVTTALAHARSLAHRTGSPTIGPRHILAGVVVGMHTGIIPPLSIPPINLMAMLTALLGEDFASTDDLSVLSTHPDAAALRPDQGASALLSKAMQVAWETKTGSVTTSQLCNALRECADNTVADLATGLVEGAR